MRTAPSPVLPLPNSNLVSVDLNVLERLERIEDVLGLRQTTNSLSGWNDDLATINVSGDLVSTPFDAAVLRLKGRARPSDPQDAWAPALIQQLWQS